MPAITSNHQFEFTRLPSAAAKGFGADASARSAQVHPHDEGNSKNTNYGQQNFGQHQGYDHRGMSGEGRYNGGGDYGGASSYGYNRSGYIGTDLDSKLASGSKSRSEMDDSEYSDSLCIRVSPCLAGLLDACDAESSDDGSGRQSRIVPPQDHPLGPCIRVVSFTIIYLLAGWTYFHGITQTTTEVKSFSGTPLAHTDIRNAIHFIRDTYDRKWWLAFYVLFTTTIIIPAFKFWASIFVIHDMAHPAVPPGSFSRFHERILHVVCSYQMADAFCATLLSAALNATDPDLGRIIVVNIHSGFYNIVVFVILSVVFQHGSEVVRLMASPQPRLFPRVRARLDRVNVIVLCCVFFITYWLAIGRGMMEMRFHQSELMFERNPVSLGQTVENLLSTMPPYICYCYVSFVVIMPNLYMGSCLIAAIIIDPEIDGEEVQGCCDLPSDPEISVGNVPPATQWRGPGAPDRILSEDQLLRGNGDGFRPSTAAGGRKRTGASGKILECAECVMFWSRPWAMFDEYVLMLWVVVFTLRLDNITAVEAQDYVFIPGLTGLKLLTGSALSLTAVRWHWFRARCSQRLPGMLSAVVILLWLGLIFIQTPKPPQSISNTNIFNSWLIQTRRGIDFDIGNAPMAAGNCGAFTQKNTGLIGDCHGDKPYKPLYTVTDSGSALDLEWVAGLNTAAITLASISRQGDAYVLQINIEMQLLMAELNGAYCTSGVCANIAAKVLTFGRRPCAKECEIGVGVCPATPAAATTAGSDFCNCNGTTFFGYQADSMWMPPRLGPQQCSKGVFGDPEPGVVFPPWPPTVAECFCAETSTPDQTPITAVVKLQATCLLPQCAGYDMIGNLSLLSADISPIQIEVPVSAKVPTILGIQLPGTVKAESNWTDAAGLIENQLRSKAPGYLNGSVPIPHFEKANLLKVVNRLIRLNIELGT